MIRHPCDDTESQKEYEDDQRPCDDDSRCMGYRLGSQGVVMLTVYMYILVVGGTCSKGGTSKDDTSKDGTSKDGTSKNDTSKDGTCCMRPPDHNPIMTRFNTQSSFLCAI